MLDAQKPFRVVSMIDPALKSAPQAVVEQYAFRRDIALVEPFFDPGNPPVIYHTRRIPRSIWSRIVMAQPTDDLKAQMCFQYGVIRVENLHTEDGVRLTFVPTGSMDTTDGKLNHIKDEEMSRFYPDEMSEIGGVIHNKSFFRPSIDVIYVPPLMCREQWARSVVYSADASPTTQAPSSARPSDQPTQPQAETDQHSASDASKSENHMVAIAEV